MFSIQTNECVEAEEAEQRLAAIEPDKVAVGKPVGSNGRNSKGVESLP